jgi:DNA-binding transcriptional ArsR family regulator
LGEIEVLFWILKIISCYLENGGVMEEKKESKALHKIHIPHDHGHATEDILDVMPKIQDFMDASEMFSQLSDSTRLRILWILCHSEECVNDIAAAVEMSAPAVSHHLKLLKQTGYIQSRREGKEVLYKLKDTEEALTLHRIVDGVFSMKCPLESDFVLNEFSEDNKKKGE